MYVFAFLVRKIFAVGLNYKCVDPSKRLHSGVTFLEQAHWLLKHMIKVLTS